MGKKISELSRQTRLINSTDFVILDRGNTPFRTRGWAYKDMTNRWMNSPVRYFYGGTPLNPIYASTRGEVYALINSMLIAMGYDTSNPDTFFEQGVMLSLFRDGALESVSYVYRVPTFYTSPDPPFIAVINEGGTERFVSGDATPVDDTAVQTLYGKIEGAESIPHAVLITEEIPYE